MTLLEFARGPALTWASIIFVIGMLWRAGGLIFLLQGGPLSSNRRDDLWRGGVKSMLSRFAPAPVFRRKVAVQYYAGLVWHVGFVVVLLLFQVHIMFFEGLLGFGWPGLPNGVILFTAVLTAAILLFLLVRRMVHPVLRHLSNFNDYSSLIVTLLPLLTGLATYAHLGIAYETLLALHFLSVALLLIWFPFSKLIHVITMLPSRYILGVKFWRKGVEI